MARFVWATLSVCVGLSVGCSTATSRESRSEKAERRASKQAGAGSSASNPAELPRMPAATGQASRVVLLIADDLGVDALSSFADVSGVASDERPFPATPNLDALCSSGVRFTQAWATPTCTPTRGSVLTGRYGFRTGLDGVGKGKQIDREEQTLPRLLAAQTQAKSANIGKWHLGEGEEIGGLRAPNVMGWDHYAGSLANLESYFEFTKVVNGEEIAVENYVTSQTVDDALSWARGLEPESSWLLWVAFNAPHVPFHLPPESLHAHPGASEAADQYDATVEALDTEIGRLLAGLPPDVTVIFLGDNGSPARIVREPLAPKRAKGTLYEGGVHVPLCVAGEGVRATGEQAALVSSVDLFATIAGLMGVAELPAGAGEDSTDLRPYLQGEAPAAPRSVLYTQQNRTHERKAKHAGGQAIRDARYKLIRFEDERAALYDLREDPRELVDLSQSSEPDVRAALARLEAELSALRGEH